MDLVAMERKLAEMSDLAAIADMSPAERASKLAEYKAVADRLAAEEEQALAQLRLDGPDNVDVQAMRALRTLARQHQAAQRSLERLQKAIAKAEKVDQDQASQIPANADCTAQPQQHEGKSNRRRR